MENYLLICCALSLCIMTFSKKVGRAQCLMLFFSLSYSAWLFFKGDRIEAIVFCTLNSLSLLVLLLLYTNTVHEKRGPSQKKRRLGESIVCVLIAAVSATCFYFPFKNKLGELNDKGLGGIGVGDIFYSYLILTILFTAIVSLLVAFRRAKDG